MLKLLKDIIRAHGGVQRWNEFSKIEAEIVCSGKLFELKELPHDTSPRQITVWLREPGASIDPSGHAYPRYALSPRPIVTKKSAGKPESERSVNPNETNEHLKSPRRDPLDRGYFSGDALWIYLTIPFFMLLQGVDVRETDPWPEGDEMWNGLNVTFPSFMATHSAVQNFYFGKDNLIRRNDYQLPIAGDFYVAQYISDIKEVQGIRVPFKLRAYKRDTDGKPLYDELMVKIDLSNFRFS